MSCAKHGRDICLRQRRCVVEHVFVIAPVRAPILPPLASHWRPSIHQTCLVLADPHPTSFIPFRLRRVAPHHRPSPPCHPDRNGHGKRPLSDISDSFASVIRRPFRGGSIP